MHRVISMCLDAAIAAVLLLPLFPLLNKYFFHNKVRSCFYFLFSVYLSGMFAVVGLPDICYVRFDPNFNFIPFQYMFSDFDNSFLNVLLFLPMGFFLPIFWRSFQKAHKTVFFGFSVSLLIEILQIFTFRASDVNDLITNTTGTFIGWCLARLLLAFLPNIAPSEHTDHLYLICAAAFAVMFFVQPFPANWIFFYL